MADDPIDVPNNDENPLPREWRFAADIAARNLGFDEPVKTMSPERWQLVLTSVETRMTMRGVLPPFGWKAALAQQVGRLDELT